MDVFHLCKGREQKKPRAALASQVEDEYLHDYYAIDLISKKCMLKL